MKHRRGQRSAALILLTAAAVGAALAARRFLRNRSGSAPSRALSRRRPGPTTPSLVTVSPADMPLGEPGHNADLRLEEALQETFPGSDPIATQIE